MILLATGNKYHKVLSGDNCWAIANQYGISLDQFYSWNPAVKPTSCQSLLPDYYVCVGVAGMLLSRSHYSPHLAMYLLSDWIQKLLPPPPPHSQHHNRSSLRLPTNQCHSLSFPGCSESCSRNTGVRDSWSHSIPPKASWDWQQSSHWIVNSLPDDIPCLPLLGPGYSLGCDIVCRFFLWVIWYYVVVLSCLNKLIQVIKLRYSIIIRNLRL